MQVTRSAALTIMLPVDFLVLERDSEIFAARSTSTHANSCAIARMAAALTGILSNGAS